MFAKRIISRISAIFLASMLILAALPLEGAHAAGTNYVKPARTGDGDCSSWVNACTLVDALASYNPYDEIWVMAGTYQPTTVTDRAATFQLINTVNIYGGFAGTETDRDQRNPAINVTILSGDIGTPGDASDNSYHVVTGATGAILDGFTITNGNADASSPNPRGGGMLNLSSSPTLANIIFSGNSAAAGGGMYNNTSNPTLTNISFTGNTATSNGGGMLNNASNPTLQIVTFTGNTAVDNGGGIYNYQSSPVLMDVTFDGNSVESYGGGMSNSSGAPTFSNLTFTGNTARYGGGLYNFDTNPTLTNITFSGNSAAYGGGLYNESSNPILENLTLGHNTGGVGGGLFNIYNSNPQINNTILWGNSGGQIYNDIDGASSVNDSVIQDGCPSGSTCSNIIATDPRLGVPGANGGFTPTIPIVPGSPAIDAGNDSTCADTDQRGVARPVRAHCDIGAFEYDYTGIYFVKTAASGTNDCQSWENACTMETAIGATLSGDEIWVQAGIYLPTSDPSDRSASIQLISGVAVYGGFAGTESIRSQRDPKANQTVLSGDIDGNDTQTPVITDLSSVSGNTTNSYHVVTGASNATLDGFTITAGNANDSGTPTNNNGGGMYNSSTSPILTDILFSGNSATTFAGGMYNTSSNPTLTNVTFTANSAAYGGGMYNYLSNPTLLDTSFADNKGYGGGGIYNSQSSPRITGATFSDNIVTGSGGGISNNQSSPILTNVVFSSNAANDGGGMYSNQSSSPRLTGVTFSGNTALGYGGGMSTSTGSPVLTGVTFNGNTATSPGGGMYNNTSSATLTNVTFSGNTTTTLGGGIFNFASSPVLTNLTFGGNAATNGGGLGNNSNSSPTIRNTIFWGNTATSGQAQILNSDAGSLPAVNYSVVQGGYATGTGNIDADPLLGTLGDYGGSTPTLPLMPGSSALDAGNGPTCAPTDQRGVTRPQGTKCDIGAYERFTGIHYAKPAATGNGNCQSWADACQLKTAFNSVLAGDEIWAAAGTHKPTTGTDRSATFHLVGGVEVYGGFAGTETTRSQRDPAANPTVLSGDLNGDDNSNVTYDEPTRADNSYHVVTGADNAILDGFTITSGNASDDGGGMFNMFVSPILANLVFNKNSANLHGGGMYNEGSSLTLTNATFSGNSSPAGAGVYNHTSGAVFTNVTFSGNSSNAYGGGMHNVASAPTLTDVTFAGNSASYGAGMVNSDTSNAVLTNVTFSDNSAATEGGGIYNSQSSPTLTNITFSGNSAGIGGGMINLNGSNPQLTNGTFANNSATLGGGMANRYNSNPQVRDTIFWGNTAGSGGAQIYHDTGSTSSVDDSVVQAGCPSGSTCNANIIIVDPLLGTLGDNGGLTWVIPLLAHSSAIDVGNTPTCALTDQRGVTRPQGAQCDIGAYEYVDTTAPIVTDFTVTTPSNSLAIPISAFVVTDDVSATGYLVNELAVPPAPDDSNWTGTPPTIYTVPIDGVYSLYAWAKDASGNVSAVLSSPRSALVDTTRPEVTAFTATTPSNSLAISIPAFSALDAFGITGYQITLSNEAPSSGDANWKSIRPATYTVETDGTYTLYPWVKDVSGNVSAVFATPPAVVVDTTPPVVTSFTATSPINSLNIPITAFSASDGIGVTGYLITTSAIRPLPGDPGWFVTPPASYTVSIDGSYTLYPWAKDEAGNISAEFATPPTVVVDTTAPVVDTFTASSPSTSLNIPIPTFGATDSQGVTGYLITTSAALPALDDPHWSVALPTTFTVTADGSYTLHPWAKDAAGNISAGFASPPTVVVDTTAPQVVSSLRTDLNPTRLAVVNFTVTFSEEVFGVETSDFDLVTTGVLNASVTGASGSGSLYTVSINTGSGNGTIQLIVPSGATITDLAGNPLASLPYAGGETYSVNKTYHLFLPLVVR